MPGSPLDATLAAELVRDLTASSGEHATVLASFTGQRLHDVPLSSVADVREATERARRAQRAWGDAGHAHRRRVLLRAHDLLLERRERLLDAIQTETGKTRGHAFEELFNAVASARYAALAARRVLRGGRRRAGIPVVLRSRVVYRPKGVVGVITPWNYPPSLTAMDVAPALAAGNGVVQKADNQGVLSVLLTRRAFVDAGVPADLWAVVAGDGPTIGAAVVDACDAVAFTGSTATGRAVATRAANRLVAASLELGGKNPVVVLDDVDPATAAAGVAHACFSAAGQLCVSAERVIVLRGVADRFVPAFVDAVRSLRLSAAFDYTADVGSLATAAQRERVRGHVEDAVAKGARVLAGGVARPDLGPYFFEPTVLTGVTDAMECSRAETFGPVVAVTVVDDVHEAVAVANDSEYALNASVFGGSRRRAEAVAARIRAGSVNVNEGYRASFSSVDAPSGGIGSSGLGRRNGPEGLLRYADPVLLSTATGLLPLPRSGPQYRRLVGAMLLTLRVLKALRRR